MTNHDIGGQVRLARERRGLTLGDAARLTKLSTGVLRAIEQNDFASLPAGMYRKAYLRTVAGEVGLDPRQIAADYETQYEPAVESVTATSEAPAPREWGRQLSPRLAIAMLIVVAMLLAAWLGLQRDDVPVSSGSVAQGQSE